ncbi:MAG: NADH-quinone oxidoreductase subunit H [Opitutae bacterium]|nr:NADH-quinone oxidoreductase subunit H [Opitutae bacterium]
MIEFLTSEPVLAILRLVIYLVAILAFVGLNAAYLVLAERKGAGWFQRRPGPVEVGPWGILQPIADGLKLISKQTIVPPGTDGLLFRIAPAMVLAPALMCLVTIPFGDTVMGMPLVGRNIDVGLLMVFSFGSINVFAIMLGGWASRNKYAVISAARIVSQNVAYEIPMLLVVVTMMMITGTLNLQEVVTQQAGGFWNWNVFRGVWTMTNPLVPVTFVIFFICMLAETNRAPFDMAEAESELIAGAFTEYAGFSWGLFFMGEYANIVVGCSMATVLFLGGWQSPIGTVPASWGALGSLLGVGFFFAKMYALIFVVIWIRWTFPRTQFYGLLNLSWKILIPTSLFTLLLTGALLTIRSLL